MSARSNLESVVQATATSNGSIREALERAARRHRDPEFVERLDQLRAELATLTTVDLVARADRHHLGRFEMRSVMVEAIATHEVGHALLVERWVAGEEMHPVEGDVDDEAGWP